MSSTPSTPVPGEQDILYTISLCTGRETHLKTSCKSSHVYGGARYHKISCRLFHMYRGRDTTRRLAAITRHKKHKTSCRLSHVYRERSHPALPSHLHRETHTVSHPASHHTSTESNRRPASQQVYRASHTARHPAPHGHRERASTRKKAPAALTRESHASPRPRTACLTPLLWPQRRLPALRPGGARGRTSPLAALVAVRLRLQCCGSSCCACRGLCCAALRWP